MFGHFPGDLVLLVVQLFLNLLHGFLLLLLHLLNLLRSTLLLINLLHEIILLIWLNDRCIGVAQKLWGMLWMLGLETATLLALHLHEV